MKTLDDLLVDVRESAEISDWCINCGERKCACRARGFSNTEMVSVRAILERIDDDARTIEQLTRSVHIVKDAEIAHLKLQLDALQKDVAQMSASDEVVELTLRFFSDRVITTMRPSLGAPPVTKSIEMNAENQGHLIVSVRDTLSGDPNAVGYVLVVQKWAKEWPKPQPKPLPLILHCPKCHLQHVDVDDESGAWATSRIHRKHLCKPEDGGCGYIWAPSNRFTVGVRELPEDGS